MQIRLEYGKNGLIAEIPDANLIGILKLKTATPLPNPDAAIVDALADPIGARPLIEMAQGQRDACVVICDITRPVPNPILLPPILKALEAGGIPHNRITLLIATGTHRPNVGEEIDALVGAEIASAYRIVNHVATDIDSHRSFDVTKRGTPVFLDRRYIEAGLRVTVGLIEPHFMAGYSGGRKLVMPGLAAMETIQAWHSPRFLEHPRAASGVIDGNPVHEEALAIAQLTPPDLIVDVTLDEENRITGVFAGELETAWRAGVSFAERHTRAALSEPADIVVTTCAGHPLDATFYQAVKGMVGALPIVKPGGSIVIAAACAEGVGSEVFQHTLRTTCDLEQFMAAIQRPDWTYIPDQWEVEELAKAVRDHTIYFVCDGIAPDTLADCFVTPAATVEQGVAAALAEHGSVAKIAVIPKGPYVIPYLV